MVVTNFFAHVDTSPNDPNPDDLNPNSSSKFIIKLASIADTFELDKKSPLGAFKDFSGKLIDGLEVGL